MDRRFSLKDHLFNADTVGQLGREYASALPHFDAEQFANEALKGFANRELLARLDWLADCLEAQLDSDFDTMAAQIEAAMPAPLDPDLCDDDFGQFIHAVPGILAVRHGLEHHRGRAMQLLYQATQRFSMEFYIRPFLNRWPEETLESLHLWAEDPNYHLRRLVSEGTRPRLPWAKAVSLGPDQTLPLLDKLFADRARYVTRSVANHLNDLCKVAPDPVIHKLERWQETGQQSQREMDWITRHALRTLVKSGHPGALRLLGYKADVAVQALLSLGTSTVAIGNSLTFDCTVTCDQELPVLVDYRIVFARPGTRPAEKVFKLKRGHAGPMHPFETTRSHRLKADATTFTWHPGPHRLILQVNGVDRAEAVFTVV